MCRINSRLKKIIHLKYLILETPYTFFSLFSRYFIVLHTLNFLAPMFVLPTTTFLFLAFPVFPFFIFAFATF